MKNQILDLVYCSSQEKYLGLPIMVGLNKYRTFQALKDRVWACISNWNNTFLSHVDKEVLLKFVVQAIPTYAMSLFSISQKIYKGIASSIVKF